MESENGPDWKTIFLYNLMWFSGSMFHFQCETVSGTKPTQQLVGWQTELSCSQFSGFLRQRMQVVLGCPVVLWARGRPQWVLWNTHTASVALGGLFHGRRRFLPWNPWNSAGENLGVMPVPVLVLWVKEDQPLWV